jgi:hypothetical protein
MYVILCNFFYVHGSVHLGKIYVLFKVKLDVLVFFISLIVSFTCFRCYLHPSSGAQLQHTVIGVCMVLVFHFIYLYSIDHTDVELVINISINNLSSNIIMSINKKNINYIQYMSVWNIS